MEKIDTVESGSGRKKYFFALAALALPIALQNLVTFVVNFADNVMVGRLGDLAISGVFIGNQLHYIVQIIISGVGTALVILGTQYWGKKDVKSIRALVSICLRIALAAGGIISLVSALFPRFVSGLLSGSEEVVESATMYVRIVGVSFVFFTLSQIFVAAQRCVEKVRFGMNLALITLGINIGLNYILIFGKLGFPALGITGAAIATLISRIVEFVIAAIYTFRFDKHLSLSLRCLREFDRYLGRSLVKYGAPVMAGELVWAINIFVYTYLIGRFTAAAIAAFNVAGMMNTLTYIWLAGIAQAVGIMTGKLVGSGAGLEQIKPYAYYIQRFSIAVGLVTGLFVFLFRDSFISLYAISPEAVAVSRQLLAVLCFTIAGTAYQFPCLAGLVKAGGNISFVFRNDTVFVFLVVIPASIIAVALNAPAWLVFFCLKSDQILKCFVAVVVINRFRWIKNLTRG